MGAFANSIDQDKKCILRNFICVRTVCEDKIDLQREKCTILFCGFNYFNQSLQKGKAS